MSIEPTLGCIHVDNDDLMTRIRVAVEDAVAVERHVGCFPVSREHEVVRLRGDRDARPLFERRRIEEADVAPQLVDQQEPARAGRVIRVGDERRRQRDDRQ